MRVKVRMLGDVSSLSRMRLELVVTPLIMDCQAEQTRHVFRCGNNTPGSQGQSTVFSDNYKDFCWCELNETFPAINTTFLWLYLTRWHPGQVKMMSETLTWTQYNWEYVPGDYYVPDYCVSGKFVCDGRVNCLQSLSEATSDEAAQFCSDLHSNKAQGEESS